ncbi:MAG: lysophospholipid acyltransferase family protein [Desulfosoma sp.]
MHGKDTLGGQNLGGNGARAACRAPMGAVSPFGVPGEDRPSPMIPIAALLGALLGTLWYALDRRHRKTAEENVRLALGVNGSAARRIVRANFRHLARVFVEFPGMVRMSARNIHRCLEAHGVEHLRRSLEKGRGVLILTSHFGNWEWMAYGAPFLLPARLNIVARPIRPQGLNRWVTALRERSGNRVIAKEHALIHALKALKRNEIVGFLLDHNAGKKTGVWAPFFGGYVLTHKTLAHIALRTGAPVHPVFNERLSDGRYRIDVEPEIPPPPSGSPQERAEAMTAAFNAAIEARIRHTPEQWYWIHRRFRRFRPEKPL